MLNVCRGGPLITFRMSILVDSLAVCEEELECSLFGLFL